MKNIVRDYFGAFRISRLKGTKNNGLFLLAYFIVMPVLIGVSGNVNFRWEYIAASAGILLPMGLSCLDTLFRSPGLDKMLYLCPMSREERKKYIYNRYCFGVGVHMFISLMGVCLIIPFSHCDIFSAMQILMNDFLVAVLIASDRNREGDMADREIGLQIGIIASAFISNIMETAVVTDELPELIVKLVLFLIFVMAQLPLAVIYGRYVKQRLDDAVCYETWQRRAA